MTEPLPKDKSLTKNLEGKEAIRKVCNSKKVNLEKVKRGNNLISMVNQSSSKGVNSSIIYHTFHRFKLDGIKATDYKSLVEA